MGFAVALGALAWLCVHAADFVGVSVTIHDAIPVLATVSSPLPRCRGDSFSLDGSVLPIPLAPGFGLDHNLPLCILGTLPRMGVWARDLPLRCFDDAWRPLDDSTSLSDYSSSDAGRSNLGAARCCAFRRPARPRSYRVSFPMESYTLAFHFPLRPGTPALLTTLNEITHRYGGRAYLARDAHCTPERVRQGYRHHEMFTTIRTESVNLSSKFASALSLRLAL